MTRRTACQLIGAVVVSVSLPIEQADYGDALARIDTHWSWLTDLLHVVRHAQPDELPDGAAAGLLVRPYGYVAVLQGEYDPAYMASLIAHEAWHARQHQQGRRYYGRAAEQEAWALQAVVLADIAPSHHAVPYLLASIAGLPDGGPLPGNPEVP